MKTSKKNIKSVGERLEYLREYLRQGAEAFGAPLGLSHTAIYQREKGKAPVEFRDALALELLHGVSNTWLLTGEGPMWTHRAVSAAEAASRLEFLSRPLIAGAASCGPGGEIQDPGPAASRYALRKDFAERILRHCGGGAEDDLFFFLCHGDSMSPTILDKEIVLLNTALGVRMAPRANGIYLVRRSPEDDEARVKRVRLDTAKGHLVLSSDNRAYTPATVDLNGTPLPHLVLGRVVWLGRYLLDTDPPESDW